jgi:hypothetical protein
MRSLTVFVTAATLLVLCTPPAAFAQARPDFSGTWMFDRASPPAEQAGVTPPQELTLKQDASVLTMSWTQGGTTRTEMFKLDGTESKTPTGVTKATWENNRIVIVLRQSLGGNEIEQRRVLSMERDDLVFELTMPGLQGGEPTVVRVVYKKKR